MFLENQFLEIIIKKKSPAVYIVCSEINAAEV